MTAMDSKPVAYAVFAPNGNIRIWSTNPALCADVEGLTVTPLYAAPPSDAAMTAPAASELLAHMRTRLATRGENDTVAWHYVHGYEAGALSLVAETQPVQREESDTALLHLNELALLYSKDYASPHHIVFTVDGLRNLIAKLRERLKP